MLREYLKSIADAIREHLGGITEPINAQTFAQKIADVYNCGFTDGSKAGGGQDYSQGYAQAEIDFWNTLQKNGTLTAYEYFFSGVTWNASTFKPIYDIKPSTAQYMFYGFGSAYNETIDLADVLEKQGVILDIGKAINLHSFSRYAHISRFPALDTRSASSLVYMFADSEVQTIDELILKDDGTQVFDSCFYQTTKLENITVSGVFGNNVGFANCTMLSKASIKSIISALSETSTGKLIKFSSATVYKHFSDDGENLNSEWWGLVENKSNVDIQLV